HVPTGRAGYRLVQASGKFPQVAGPEAHNDTGTGAGVAPSSAGSASDSRIIIAHPADEPKGSGRIVEGHKPGHRHHAVLLLHSAHRSSGTAGGRSCAGK